MRPLPRPVDDAQGVFVHCVERVRNPDLRVRLLSVRGAIAAAAASFEEAAQNHSVHSYPQSAAVDGVVTADEMVAVYAQRMAKKGSPGRAVYERLLAAPPHGRCPLCGQRVASTLDHHLPKQLFPQLAVSPLNLVPACKDCNKAKGDFVATNAGQQTLHPYFDDIEAEPWLVGELVEDSPPAVLFQVNAPAHWSPELRQRVEHHFERFELGALYASHAAEELVNIRFGLRAIFVAAGADAVRSHLSMLAASYSAVRQNSWQAAMFRALVGSDWFCDGGFAVGPAGPAPEGAG